MAVFMVHFCPLCSFTTPGHHKERSSLEILLKSLWSQDLGEWGQVWWHGFHFLVNYCFNFIRTLLFWLSLRQNTIIKNTTVMVSKLMSYILKGGISPHKEEERGIPQRFCLNWPLQHNPTGQVLNNVLLPIKAMIHCTTGHHLCLIMCHS